MSFGESGIDARYHLESDILSPRVPWIWGVAIDRGYHGIKGDVQVLGLNNLVCGVSISAMWSTGRTSLGWHLGKSLAYVSFLLDWKLFKFKGLTY